MRTTSACVAAIIAAGNLVSAQASADTIRSSAKTVVDNILEIYNNGSSPSSAGFIPGLFPENYYWWESGLAWDSLINYWAYYGNETMVETIQQALLFQTGPDNNYMPTNQTKSLGNDDQSSWALAAMSAAELGLQVPSSTNVTWYELAKNVFDNQVARWDEGTCNGGLRWQIFTFNNGYNYKNALTQANFAQLGARLWHYTGNQTYLDWAGKAVQWATATGLIASGADKAAAIYDGFDVSTNCSSVNKIQWTITTGQFMSAYAYACNGTSACSDEWKTLGTTTLSAAQVFIKNSSVITEIACAGVGSCNTDQLAFRAPLARAFANARDMAGLKGAGDAIQSSASGAVSQCSDKGCGSDWSKSQWDGTSGLGQDVAALEIMMATLPRKQVLTLNSSGSGTTGGSSGGSAGNGTNGAGGSGGGSSGSGGGHANAADAVSASVLLICIVAAFATIL